MTAKLITPTSLRSLILVNSFLLAAGLASCTNFEIRECDNVRQRAVENFGSYRIEKPDDVTKAAIQRIQSCEPLFKYGSLNQPMSFETVARDRLGRKTLIFGMMYVADVKRAHILNDQGQVTASYVTGW